MHVFNVLAEFLMQSPVHLLIFGLLLITYSSTILFLLRKTLQDMHLNPERWDCPNNILLSEYKRYYGSKADYRHIHFFKGDEVAQRRLKKTFKNKI